MTRYLKSGAIAGAAGGIVLALVLRLVGEGPLSDAVALEHARPGVHQEMFTRTTQQAGGMLGAVIFGVCAGLVFATVFAAARHRLPGPDDWARAVALATTAFVTIALVPALKYPANPPGVGEPGSIGRRTALYLVMLGWSLFCTGAAWRTWQAARRRWPTATAVPIALSGYVALVVVALVVLPGIGDPIGLPATLIWRFRLAALGGAAAFWAVTGLTLGALLVREDAKRTVSSEARGALVGARNG